MPIFRCLFCNHANPAEASFCNACGSQLDLQPCGQCGAVDSRAAKSCHKCGTPFMPPSASEFDTLLPPQAHGDPWDYSSRIEASVAGAKAMVQTHDQPRTSNYSLLTVGAVAADGLVPTTRSGSGWLVPGIALLAVLMAASSAIFYQRPVATVPMQAAQQVAPQLVDPTTVPTPLTTPVRAAQSALEGPAADAMPAQAQPVAPIAVIDGPAKIPARTAPRAAPVLAVPPVQVTDTLPPARRAPPVIKECSPAAATLGLCNP